jgi:thiamine-triphosphatase
MVEIEKKFSLNAEQEKKLLAEATFINERIFTDVYFDKKDHYYTVKDIWIRKRDDRFELKVPQSAFLLERASDQYEEIEDDKKIAEFLKLPVTKPLVEVLEENDIVPFCKITTKRKKYKKDKFTIDIDEMDFGYNVCEIELMVDDASEGGKAEVEIIDFASRFDLPNVRVRGKVLEFLRINDPEHMVAIENRYSNI